MELWAIVPELILAGSVLALLPAGAFLRPEQKSMNTWLALGGLGAALAASIPMLSWPARDVFHHTYAVDPLAAFFKIFAVSATALVLLATHGHFRNRPHEGTVPPLLVLACLGIVGLAASQDLALIALFVQLIAVSSYILVGIAKENRLSTEGALKLFLFSSVAGAFMIFGMALLFGLTGTLQLPEIAQRLPGWPLFAILAALGLVVIGYGFKITMAPFHMWAPDTYQGAPTPITGYLAVGPKAAGLAVLLRTLVVAFPVAVNYWSTAIAVLCAVTMTVGNVLALRQTSVKRLLAYSSIAQAGYLLIGVAALRHGLGLPGLMFYLSVYLFMTLGAFLAVEALEQNAKTDDLDRFAGLGHKLPIAALVLTLCLLSLAGLPPLGGFVSKTMLLAAALGTGWTSLAVLMGANVAMSLYYCLRVIERLYLAEAPDISFPGEPLPLRIALIVLGAGTLLSGIIPQPWLALATHASQLVK